MSHEIAFGTDGWRAVIADAFTFDNVRLVTRAITVAAQRFEAPPSVDRNTLVVGYDRRFLSAEFSAEVAVVLRDAGFHVLLSDAPTPSQNISHAVRARNALAGVIVTASHNPAKYNGLKVKGWYGGSALPEMYHAVAQNLGREAKRAGGSIEPADILTPYVEALRGHVDVAAIRSAGTRILHDPIYGAASAIPARVLGGPGLVETIRGEVNPSFGGVNPEPIPTNLGAARAAMAAGRFDLAICNDGDADRLGILDENGEFVSPHKVLSLLTLYLTREKREHGEIVKTFSTTRLIERITTALGIPMHETAIGFKYIADIMLVRDVLVGGEESGGIAFGSFLPERDGILSGLIVAECVARMRQPLSKIIAGMEEEFGALHYDRKDLHRPQQAIDRLIEGVRSGALDTTFGDVQDREEIDGVKLNFRDGSWLLFRQSGTEPIIRIYCESPDAGRVEELLERAETELGR